MNQFLAIDAGQSGLRARLLSDDPARGTDSPDRRVTHHPGIRTDLPLAAQLADVIVAQVAESGPIDSVAIGSTGFTGHEELSELGRVAHCGVRTVLITHDSITSYLGALGDKLGVVVAAGTGVVTFAVGPSTTARVDGWGNIFGDAGSGYWFGREALDAAIRAYDGRGSRTALLDKMAEEFDDLEAAYIELQSDPHRVQRVASFSRWVTEAEADGDLVATEICQRGAAELAISAATGLSRVGLDAQPETSVCVVGGVFRSPTVTQAFEHELRRRHPEVLHCSPEGDTIDGAAHLFTLASSSSLNQRIVRITLA